MGQGGCVQERALRFGSVAMTHVTGEGGEDSVVDTKVSPQSPQPSPSQSLSPTSQAHPLPAASLEQQLD